MKTNIDQLPLVSLPTKLCDGDAAQLLDFFHELARVLENQYADQLHRYRHPENEQQYELWNENDPPF